MKRFAIFFLAALPFGHLLAATQGERRDGLSFTLTETAGYDDNLFRLPENFQLAGGRRADWVNRAGLSAVLSKSVSLQQFDLSARIGRTDYRQNDNLSNTSGGASANWLWRVGSRLDGSAGAAYSRELAGFQNNRFLSRDPIESTSAFASGRLRILRRISLTASARRNETSHDVELRRFDDLTLDSGGIGVEYRTALDNVLAWDYRYTRGDYRAVQGLDRDFRENYSGGRWLFHLRSRFTLQGSLGYADREPASPGSLAGFTSQFSGLSGRGSVIWDLGAKTRVVLEGWRELQAYADAESDYFVAKGAALRPEWQMSSRVQLSAQMLHQEMKFLGTSVFAPTGLARRADTLDSGQIQLRYAVSESLALSTIVRRERRGSSRAEFGFTDNRADISVQLTY